MLRRTFFVFFLQRKTGTNVQLISSYTKINRRFISLNLADFHLLMLLSFQKINVGLRRIYIQKVLRFDIKKTRPLAGLSSYSVVLFTTV